MKKSTLSRVALFAHFAHIARSAIKKADQLQAKFNFMAYAVAL